MKEKEAIERATADAFIRLFNSEMGTAYEIDQYSDNPDIRCKDAHGNKFNFEITLTEDRPKDIQAMLGRSDHKSIESLRAHLKDVREGKANPFEKSNQLLDVSEMLFERIKVKSRNDYGNEVALVIRDTSGVNWDWDSVLKPLSVKCQDIVYPKVS